MPPRMSGSLPQLFPLLEHPSSEKPDSTSCLVLLLRTPEKWLPLGEMSKNNNHKPRVIIGGWELPELRFSCGQPPGGSTGRKAQSLCLARPNLLHLGSGHASWGFSRVKGAGDVTGGTRGGCQGAREEGHVTPPLPSPVDRPTPHLPLDGCRHLVPLLHDAFEHRVAQAWERHETVRRPRESPQHQPQRTLQDK